MARVWKLDRAQYGSDGLLSLYRGDDWSVRGTLVDRVNGYETPVDASTLSATGFFPAAGGGVIAAPAVTGQCGVVTVSLPAASSVLAQVNTGGEGIYLVTSDGAVVKTVPSDDEAVVILDRGFPTG